MMANRRSISFGRAQEKVCRYRYDQDPMLRVILYRFLQQLESVQDLNLYAFLFTRAKSSSFSQLAAIYSTHTEERIHRISALSVDASNALFEALPPSHRRTKSCTLYFPHSLNMALKSHLEVACLHSLASLNVYLDLFYAVLPMPEMKDSTKAAIKSEVLAMRRQQRRTSFLPEEPDFESNVHLKGPEYGLRLVKQLIYDLHSLADAGELHKALVNPFPIPLLKMTVITKRARNSIISTGRDSDLPHLETPQFDPETHLPRLIREGKKRSNSRFLQQRAVSSIIYSIIYTKDECEDSEGAVQQELQESDTILATERLRWVGAGRDKSSVQPWPDLVGMEKGLETLILRPLQDIGEIPEVTCSGSTLISVFNHMEKLADVFTKARNLLENSLYAPLALIAILRQYEYLAQESQSELLERLINAHIDDYTGLGVEMKTIQFDLRAVQSKFPDHLNFGMIEVDLTPCKREMHSNGTQLLHRLLEELIQEYLGLLNYTEQQFSLLMEDLKKAPNSVEELKELTNYIESKEDLERFNGIQNFITKAMKIQQILTDFQQAVDPAQLTRALATRLWESELVKSRKRMVVRLARCRPAFIEQVLGDAARLRTAVELNKAEMKEFEEFSDLEQASEYAFKAEEVLSTLRQCAEDVGVLNSREKVLELPLSDLGDFKSDIEKFGKYAQLWTFARSWTAAWSEWHYKSFRLINAEAVERQFTSGLSLLQNLEPEFRELPKPFAVLMELKRQLNGFEMYVKLILQLRHVSIRDRHWESLLTLLSLAIKPEFVTLSDLSSALILEHQSTVDTICHQALNEYAVEVALERVETHINSFTLTLEGDELPLLSGLEDMENCYLELLSTVKFIEQGNKFIGLFRTRIEKATGYLTSSLQTIKDIKEMQTRWSSLYPLLQVPYITSHLSSQSTLIERLHTFYTRQMTLIANTQILSSLPDLPVRSTFEACEGMQNIHKKVKEIIRALGAISPRLQLLHYKEIAELLLGITRKKELIPLDMLFQGIESVNLPIDTLEINALFHGPAKIIIEPAISMVNVKPEIWINSLEMKLKSIFQAEIRRVLSESEREKEEWWKSSQDPQVLLTVQRIRFSQGICDPAVPIRLLSDEYQSFLTSITTEIRPTFLQPESPAPLTLTIRRPSTLPDKSIAAKRMKLENLALQTIYYLHFIKTVGGKTKDHFMWQALCKLEINREEVYVTCFNNRSVFGYEYHPLPLPLFIPTPISDRCILNFASVLRSSSTGLLLGPISTGKIDTLLEFSLLHGKEILRWTISNSINPDRVMRVLSGCAAAGLWMCLEEVHNLDLPVLSSLGYYLVRLREQNLPGTVMMEDWKINVKREFAFWASSEKVKLKLPLRVMEAFRTIAVVQPDLGAVAEIRLRALGFKQAKEMGRKIGVTLMSLRRDGRWSGEEREGLQGMATVRTVNSVVDRVAAILDAYQIQDDNYLLNNSFRRVLGTSLSPPEEVNFDEFLTTIFHSSHNNIISGTNDIPNMETLTAILETEKVEMNSELMRSVRYLWVNVVEGRRVVLITGPPGSGKTTLFHAVALAYSQSTGTKFSIPVLSSQVSNEGIISLFHSCSSQQPSKSYPCFPHFQQPFLSPNDWIYFNSSEFDSSVFISIARNQASMHTSQRKKVPSTLRLVIETENLKSLSPDLIPEIGLIHCSDSNADEALIFKKTLETGISIHVSQLSDLYDSTFKKVYKGAVAGKPVIPLTKRTAGFILGKWLVMLLGPKQSHGKKRLVEDLVLEKWNSEEMKGNKALLDGRENDILEVAWVLSIIGGIGNLLTEPAAFEAAVRKMIDKEPEKFAKSVGFYIQMNGVSSLSALAFDFTRKEWTNWMEYNYTDGDLQLPPMQSSPWVYIPTVSSQTLAGWMDVITDLGFDVAVLGPSEVGKSTITTQVLRRKVTRSFASVVPVNVMQGVSGEAVQYAIMMRMEEMQRDWFGALGGRRLYVYIEDWNEDSSSLCESIRWLREHSGWYYRDHFRHMEDLTFIFTLNGAVTSGVLRTLRHFISLYKTKYSEKELQTLFRTLPISYSTLNSNENWQHTGLSNCLQSFSLPDSELAFTQRYLSDQMLSPAPPTLFIPSLLQKPRPEPMIPFHPSSFPLLLFTFQQLATVCEKSNPGLIKVARKMIMRTGEKLTRQLYLFCGLVTDLQAGQNCLVVTAGDLSTARAVALMAAELHKRTVVDIRVKDVAVSIVNSFTGQEQSALPTTTKLALRGAIERASQGLKSLYLLSLDSSVDLESPALTSLLDLLTDVTLGKEVKLIGRLKTIPADLTYLYPDQINAVLRERCQRNITIILLIQSPSLQFDRYSPSTGLELIKTRYKPLFATCRLMAVDCIELPRELMTLSETIKRPLDVTLDIMRHMGESLPIPIDDFAIERAAYVAKVMQKADERKLVKELTELRTATRWCVQIEQESRQSLYQAELQRRIEALRTQLHTMNKTPKDPSKAIGLAEAGIKAAKKAFLEQYNRSKERMKKTIADFGEWMVIPRPTPNDQVLIAALRKILDKNCPLFPFGRADLYAEYCKETLSALRHNRKDIQIRLNALDVTKLPELQEYLTRVPYSEQALELFSLIQAVEEVRALGAELVSKNAAWLQQAMTSEPSDDVQELQAELTLVEEELQQVMVLRPKIARLSSDIQGLRKEWEGKADALTKRLSHSPGNSLQAATMFVLGVGMMVEQRTELKTAVQGFLEKKGIAFDKEGEPEGSFLQGVRNVCGWVWRLILPYPVFIDPYGLAGDLLPNRMTYDMPSSTPFEEVLSSCLLQGRSLLVRNPSPRIIQSLWPVLQWRWDRSLEVVRDESPTSPSLTINSKSILVHSDFRLFLSVTSDENRALLDLCTVVSLEPRDKDSWMACLFRVMPEVQVSNSAAIFGKGPKEEILSILGVARTGPIYRIPGFSTVMTRAQRIAMYEAEEALRLIDHITDPLRSLYEELLEPVMRLNQEIQSLHLQGWSISPLMYRNMLQQACDEQFDETGQPTKDQYSSLVDPILFRFLVRILWSLPPANQSALLLLHCVHRYYPNSDFPVYKQLLLDGLQLPFTTSQEVLTKRFRELVDRLPAFPTHFTERSVDFNHFVHRSFYNEGELEGLDLKLQVLLIAWLRQDLLPQFLRTVIADCMGKRFIHLPNVDFSLLPQLFPPTSPIVLFSKEADPVPFLRLAAANLDIGLVNCPSLVPVNAGDKHVELRLRRVIRVMMTLAVEKRWVLLEGFESMSDVELETLYKAFSQARSQDNAHPEFRLWILLQSKPTRLTQWDRFIQHSFRIVLPQPTTVRDRLITSYIAFNAEDIKPLATRPKNRYIESTQTAQSSTPKPGKRSPHINSLIRATISRILKPESRDISPKSGRLSPSRRRISVAEASEGDIMRFNMCLAAAAIELRQRFVGDVGLLLSWKGVLRSLEDILQSDLDKADEDRVWEASGLFLQLVGVSWELSGFFAGLNILKQCLLSPEPVLKFTPRDASGDVSTVEYPRYRPGPFQPIDKLLLSLPHRDHLQLVGLPQSLQRLHQHLQSNQIAKMLFKPLTSPLHFPSLLSLLSSLLTDLNQSKEGDRDYNNAYEQVLPGRVRRFSYFFLPDKYRMSDVKSKVLLDKPDFKRFVGKIERENEKRRKKFVTSILQSIERMQVYFHFTTQTLTKSDRSALLSLSENRTPSQWLQKSPYFLRRETDLNLFLHSIPSNTQEFSEGIALKKVFDPAGVVLDVMRWLCFAEKEDYAVGEMEWNEGDGEEDGKYRVKLADLYLYNSELDGNRLKDSYDQQPFSLGLLTCSLSPPHSWTELAPRPRGLLIHYKPSLSPALQSAQRESRLNEIAQIAFSYAQDEQETPSDPISPLNLISVPLFPTLTGDLWVLFPSEFSQSHWSKRNVYIDI